MIHWEYVFSIIAVIVLSIGLIYTAKVSRRQKYQGEYDAQISEKIQDHPILRNPVFLAYIIGIGLALAYMVYIAVNSNY